VLQKKHDYVLDRQLAELNFLIKIFIFIFIFFENWSNSMEQIVVKYLNILTTIFPNTCCRWILSTSGAWVRMGETGRCSNSNSSFPAPAHIQTQPRPNQTASSPFKTKVSHSSQRHAGNTVEKNFGYVVFKWNIHISAGKRPYSARPLFYSKLLDTYLKTTNKVFLYLG
jgi:hypothetical protein